MLMADIAVINKIDSADPANVARVRQTIEANNAKAAVVLADSAIIIGKPGPDPGANGCWCVEDGPTLTHGEMAFGAGTIAAQRHQAAEIVDPPALSERDPQGDV